MSTEAISRPNMSPHRKASLDIRSKILLAVAVPLVFAIAVGGIAIVNIQRMAHTQGWVDHTQRVLGQAASILGAAVDMETGMRGFLLAGQDQFLETYENGGARVFKMLSDLRQTVSDNPPQVEKLQDAEDILKQWQTDVVAKLVALRREIGDAPTMNDVAGEVSEARGQVFFNTFRDLIDRFITAETRGLAKRQMRFEAMLTNQFVKPEMVRRAKNALRDANARIAEAQALYAAGINMETGMRGYLLAGQDSFLAPLTAGEEEFTERLRNLQTAVSGSESQLALLSEIESVIGDWRASVVTPMIALRHEIGDAKTMDDMADIVGEARGKAYFDAFRVIMADFTNEERALMVVRQAENASTQKMTIRMTLGALGVGLVVGGSLAVGLGTNIGRSLRQLADGMRQLSEGDLGVAIQGQDRGDEVGLMSRATEVFKQNALKMDALNARREADAKRLSELAEEREAAAAREAEARQEQDLRDQRAQQQRDAMMAELDASFGLVVDAAAQGDFAKRINADFKDEVLVGLARKMNTLMHSVDTGLSAAGTTLQHISEGDLTQEMRGNFKGAFADLQHHMNSMVASLRQLIGGLSDNSASVAQASSNLTRTAEELSREAEANASALAQTSTSVESIAESFAQITANVSASSNLARQARETAKENENVASEAVASMEKIAEASQEIERVVSVIDGITFQINLLALNAGVEAARAGDAGRGFSVVASEVRALAQRSSDAATEITQVIGRTNSAISDGVTKVTAAKSSLDQIAENVLTIASSIDEASEMISNQATGLGQVTSSVTQIDNTTQRQVSAFEDITASSTDLANQANDLQSAAASFHLGRTKRALDAA